MFQKVSVVALSLFVAAFMVGCGTATQPNNPEDSNRVIHVDEDDAMMNDDTMMEDDSMMEDDAMMDGDEDDAMMTDDAMKDDTMMEDDSMAMTDGEVVEFTVEGTNFSFTPNNLTVNEGDTVRVTFKNTGGMHDFRIDEFEAKTNVIQTGEEETITFVADKAGTYEFYCSVGSHRAMGMVGTLVVQ